MINILDINKIYNMDCLEGMKDISDKSINLIVIDPPYNIGKDKRWDKWKTVSAYVEWMGKVFIECQRVLKDNGSFYFFHNDFLQMVELQNWLNQNSKFVFKQLIVWNKKYKGVSNEGFLQGFIEPEGLRNYQKMVEYCLYYTFQEEAGLQTIKSNKELFLNIKQYLREEKKKSGLNLLQINQLFGINISDGIAKRYFGDSQWELPIREKYKMLQTTGYWKKPYKELRQEYESLRYIFNNQKTHHSVWNYEIAKKRGHITPKPVELIENIIKHSSNEGDIVLDCFIGSGTTAIASLNTGRFFIGYELDKNYYEIAIKRIKGNDYKG